MAGTARFPVVFIAAIVVLATAAPIAAAEPALGGDTGDVTHELEPTGAPGCDVRLSLVGGPLVDANFSVRGWEPFVVSGFGFPVDTTVFLDFTRFETFTFNAVTDSAGEFAQEHYFDPGGPEPLPPEDWTLTAEPIGGECIDGIALRIEPAYPFFDIDGFAREIAWLYREGITGGCTATSFCPRSSVTRGQMAAFLNRALDLPATSTDFFDDDDGTSFEGDINRLAAAGVTGGCASRLFCANASVTREQMASFLARAFSLPDAAPDYFGDDDASVHEGDINRLAQSGITGGCGDARYCPRSLVTREQMAAFLYRALSP